MEKVPIKSYYKSTLATIYDNEGELSYTVPLLMAKIKKNRLLYKKLVANGYEKTAHGLTAEQVNLVFQYLHHPVLNQKNRELLKIPLKPKNILSVFYSLMPKNGNVNLKPINELSDNILASLGLIKNPNPDYNFYTIESTKEYCFVRNDGYLKLCSLPDFKGKKQIYSTRELIEQLMEFENGKCVLK